MSTGELEHAAPMTAFFRLYHPRGPLVSMGLPMTDGLTLLTAISGFMDAGFTVAAPGLDEGEEKEQISHVVRGIFERDGEETPIVLLYSANEAMKWSILKLYLNTEGDIESFERASGMKLNDIPLYVGQDKPARGASKAIDRFIAKAPKHFGVVFKHNPKYDPNETDATKKKPARLFVRWTDQPPANGTPPAIDADASLQLMAALHERMLTATTMAALEAVIPDIKAQTLRLTPEHTVSLRTAYTEEKRRIESAAVPVGDDQIKF